MDTDSSKDRCNINRRDTMTRTTWAAVAAYIASIVAANLLVAEYGPKAIIVNAFVFIGLDLVLRDYLHDAWGGARSNLFALIAAGGALTYAINADAGRIALASSVAFGAAALIDWAVYSSAKRWTWLARSNASNVAGAAVDSMLFPTLAFGAVLWPIVLGQFVAKTLGGAAWSLLIAAARPVPTVVAAHDNRA